ncbi:hypothetical protein TNCT_395761 [Trichonephila clavata]|uniref:Uncharacterized protein n=1 Tax=Trichonephila clavata TaxID=2740835 RepID=A0A8X6F0W3_TRICU|nr:hypothetical protein TNCT_395761 [Trichonephila clavata]
MMDFSSRHMMIPPESIKKEILEDSSQEALLSIQKVPSLSDLSKENSLADFRSDGRGRQRREPQVALYIDSCCFSDFSLYVLTL